MQQQIAAVMPMTVEPVDYTAPELYHTNSSSTLPQAKLKGIQHVRAQLTALVRKNILLLLRRPMSSLFYLLVPSLVVVAMYELEDIVAPDIFRNGETAHLQVQRCQVFSMVGTPIPDAQCTTVGAD